MCKSKSERESNDGRTYKLYRLPATRTSAASVLYLRGGGGSSSDSTVGGEVRLQGFEVHYRCSRHWDTAYVHYSIDDGATWSRKPGEEAGGTMKEDKRTGKDSEMGPSPAGPNWKTFSLPPLSFTKVRVAQNISFVFHDGKGNWDSGPEGTYYRLEHHGRYALKDGRFSLISEGLSPVLVVTDLDGTYIGDEGAIAELNDCWERQCVYSRPHPSVFVYNTGRSWESTRQVMRDLQHIPMMTPKAVIASVGTQVCA